ncbi:MAG: nitronate monooxygenase [Capsulimonadales bacterium]|nr:nitronate monooxygenase [Capsulimonadales bacterium]
MERTSFAFGKSNRVRPRGKRQWQLANIELRTPIVQATLGDCDGPRLAAEVSRAGALGCLSVHDIRETVLRRRLARIRARTARPVLISFTYQWHRDSVPMTCLEAGFRHFQVFWWNGPRFCRLIRQSGGTIFWQVGSDDQAREALDCGADILVAQGTEAGGPVRSPYPLRELIARLRDRTGDRVPIVAGGGLANAEDVAEVLSWGASAAMLGTRFLLSEESQAERRCKSRLLRADSQQLVLDPRMIGDWPCAPRRRLVTARDEDKSALFAGSGLSRISDLLPAAEIVRRLTPPA